MPHQTQSLKYPSMDGTIKIALLVSIWINILLLALGINFIIKRGGFAYLKRKLAFWGRYKSIKNIMYDNPFYWDKKSHFENLPKSETEIIFLGDSLTDLCEWSEVFSNNCIKNRGICGDTTDGILNRITNIVESQPQKIFLMIGINDLCQEREILEILNNYQLILSTLKEKTPNTKVYIQSLLPVNSQGLIDNKINKKVIEVNTSLKEIAKSFSFQYIDLFTSFLDKNNRLDPCYTSDGVHLNGEGYLVWKKIIEKYVVN